MQKQNVHVGTTYIVKVSGTLAKVRLTREHDRGGRRVVGSDVLVGV